MGGVVCATESAAGCPDWPGCYGRIVPPPQINAIIEYAHRLIAALTSPLIIAAAVVSWRRTRAIRWVFWPLAVSLVFLVAVVIFGAFAVLTGLPRGVAALDLSSALVVLGLVVTATVVAFARRADPDLPDRLGGGAYGRLTLAALAALLAVYAGGVLVAGKGSFTRCLGWPVAPMIATDLAGWPQTARFALSALAGILIVAAVAQGLGAPRSHTVLRRLAGVVGLAFLVEMAAGALIRTGGAGAPVLIIYVAAAAVLWASLVALAVQARIG
jgi:cytochrome c oxidase assembly protein subunit 15